MRITFHCNEHNRKYYNEDEIRKLIGRMSQILYESKFVAGIRFTISLKSKWMEEEKE